MRGVFDKIDLVLPESLKTSLIKDRATFFSGRTETVSRQGKALLKYYPQGSADSFISFHLYTLHSKYSRFVYKNPSQFKNFSEFVMQLRMVLPINFLQHAKLCRIDCAVDYELPLSSLKSGLHISRKSAVTRFISKSSHNSGLSIGKRPEEFLLYDKGKHAKLDHDLTRLEVRLTKKKLPVGKLGELPQLARPNEEGRRFRPFKAVDLKAIEVVSYKKLTSKREIFKAGELSALINECGFHRAKQILGKTRNYGRDYEPLTTVRRWAHRHPNEIFSESMTAFFSNWDSRILTMGIPEVDEDVVTGKLQLKAHEAK